MLWWSRFGQRCAALAQRVVPDPFILAVLLAGLVMVMGATYSQAPTSVLTGFAAGMLGQAGIAFAFQMALILVTGHALADAPAVRRGLGWVAQRPRTGGQAAALVGAAAMGLGLLNWGLGLVGGAFLAREVGRAFARRGQPLTYPLVGAAGYCGLLVWHGGLSGSAPLKVAAADNVFARAITVGETLFTPLNLVASGLVLIVVTGLLYVLGSGPVVDGPGPPLDDEAAGPDEADDAGLVSRLSRARGVTAILVLPIVVYLAVEVGEKGAGAVGLNAVILFFLVLGLALHARPLAYARSFSAGAQGAAGILLQFPIYFGILGAAKASGILTALSQALIAVAHSLPAPDAAAAVMTYISAAVVNLLVPSGGGQWVLQAPLIVEATTSVGADAGTMVMAFSYGDQLTNMLQPFWALPLLSVTGLKARDLMGYTLLVMMAAAPVYAVCLVLFSV